MNRLVANLDGLLESSMAVFVVDIVRIGFFCGMNDSERCSLSQLTKWIRNVSIGHSRKEVSLFVCVSLLVLRSLKNAAEMKQRLFVTIGDVETVIDEENSRWTRE